MAKTSIVIFPFVDVPYRFLSVSFKIGQLYNIQLPLVISVKLPHTIYIKRDICWCHLSPLFTNKCLNCKIQYSYLIVYCYVSKMFYSTCIQLQ